jgi:hypothetical protein
VKRLEAIIRDDPGLMPVMECLRDVALPQWRIVAGCLYQTVWNVLADLPRGTGIQDIDVIYYDDDLSWEAEDTVITHVTSVCRRGLGETVPLQVRNQARVHLWYERRFGVPWTPSVSADDSLSRFPAAAGAIGARLEPDGRLDLIAPFGVDDLFAMIMRPNPLCPHLATFDAKVARARAIWPVIAVP